MKIAEFHLKSWLQLFGLQKLFLSIFNKISYLITLTPMKLPNLEPVTFYEVDLGVDYKLSTGEVILVIALRSLS